jgi:hypothetical protein
VVLGGTDSWLHLASRTVCREFFLDMQWIELNATQKKPEMFLALVNQ